MKLDRVLQRQLLERLADTYPDDMSFDADKISDAVSTETINLWYLHQHGLVEAKRSEWVGAPTYVYSATITHRGLDFLADDGGLSAILGTVIVKLHADTLRDLFEAKVAASSLPAAEKKHLIDHLRALPAEVLQKAAERLVDTALDRWQDAIPLLQKFLDYALR